MIGVGDYEDSRWLQKSDVSLDTVDLEVWWGMYAFFLFRIFYLADRVWVVLLVIFFLERKIVKWMED